MRRVAVVGASLAGVEATRELRRAGFAGDVVEFGDEAVKPYDRPPLSKAVLAGTVAADSTVLDLGEAADAEWRLGTPATALDAAGRIVHTATGAERFDGIVVATGGVALRPRLWSGSVPAGVHVLRTVADSGHLAAALRAGPRRVLVVGAGVVGTEIASTCRELGVAVTVVDSATAPMERLLGGEVGAAVADVVRAAGVDLRLRTTVRALYGSPRVERAELSDGSVVAADVVVLAVGARPATDWLTGSGLTLDDGVVCEPSLLAAPGIVAAGGVARWPHRRYGGLLRVKHWDNAIRQGRHAARTLLSGRAGSPPFDAVPWMWTDQFGMKIQVLGSTSGHEEVRTVSGSLGGPRFVCLYRRGDRAVAAVSVNSAKGMLRCRALLDRDATWAEAIAAFDARPGPRRPTHTRSTEDGRHRP
jgi:3-phenylpropionate/trans-cinnamate dioxygenase ferredoxin reductase subunit